MDDRASWATVHRVTKSQTEVTKHKRWWNTTAPSDDSDLVKLPSLKAFLFLCSFILTHCFPSTFSFPGGVGGWGGVGTWFCYLVGVSLCLWTSAVLISVNFHLCFWGCLCALLSKSLALENNRGKLHYWYCQYEVQLVPKYIVIKSQNGWHRSRMLSFIKDWGQWYKLMRILGPR